MKKIYQQILDFPQMVNQKVFNAQLNTAVDKFDSQDGVRSYTKSIYQILSLIVLITMEVAVIKGAMAYFTDAASTGLGKAGSVLTTLVLVYSAFPIAHIIRSRGESLGGSHNGIVTFIFKDFVTTNIKILGEVAAVGAFIGATCFTLSFVFDTNLFTVTNSECIYREYNKCLYMTTTAKIVMKAKKCFLALLINKRWCVVSVGNIWLKLYFLLALYLGERVGQVKVNVSAMCSVR